MPTTIINPKMGSNPNNRLTAGFIIRDNMSANFDIPIWQQIIDTAGELDVNLVTYMTHPMWYSQDGLELNEGIYNQINNRVIDGLVSFDMGLSWVSEKLAHYAGFPNVILNYPVKGYPCITISQEGMRYAIDHLIEVHHKQRILYISGNKGNAEAEARVEAYKKSLQAHQIQFDPQLFFYGNFSDPNCGENVIKEALDVKKLKFDAVACANDIIASSAAAGLNKHGLAVPYDIPVTGFDDDIRATSSLPTLTTVKASFGELTRLGLQRLYKVLNHEHVPNTTETFPTQLVIRNSCGCLSDTILTASSRKNKPDKGLVLNVDIEAMGRDMSAILGPAAGSLEPDWYKELWLTLNTSLQKDDRIFFLKTLDMMQRRTFSAGFRLEKWQMVLSVFRNHAVNALKNRAAGAAQPIEDLVNQGRILTSEMTANAITRNILFQSDANDNLMATIQILLSRFSMQGLLDALSSDIVNNLDLASLHLVLYEGSQWPPQNARLVLAWNRATGRKELQENGIIFSADRVLPDEFIPTGRRYHLVSAPLYFQDENLGYIVFEPGPIGSFFAPLQKLIASALKGALLFEQRDELLKHVAQTSSQISDTSAGLTKIVEGTVLAMYQITQSMNQIAKGANEEAVVISNAVNSIDMMASSSQKISSEAQTGSEFSEKAAQDAHTGSDLGEATVAGMQEIKDKMDVAYEKVNEMSTRSQQISLIIETIDDITAQTNMLALNAAIEAARAGEQGRGFSVVASEVRKLAEKSSNSTREISALIHSIQQAIADTVQAMETSQRQVSSGMVRADESNAAMNEIQKSAAELNQRVKAISAAAIEIAGQSNKISGAVEDIASVSEENTAATEEVNASAEQVNRQMEEMSEVTAILADTAEAMQKLVARYQ